MASCGPGGAYGDECVEVNEPGVSVGYRGGKASSTGCLALIPAGFAVLLGR